MDVEEGAIIVGGGVPVAMGRDVNVDETLAGGGVSLAEAKISDGVGEERKVALGVCVALGMLVFVEKGREV